MAKRVVRHLKPEEVFWSSQSEQLIFDAAYNCLLAGMMREDVEAALSSVWNACKMEYGE